MAEGFARPTRLSFEGNVAENWRRFKQNYDVYIVAAEHSRKTKKERPCILLKLAGEDAVERHNSFTFDEGVDRDDPDVLKQKALSICSSSELSEQQVKNLADNEDVHEVSSLRSYESRRDKRRQRQLKKPDSSEQSREATETKMINKCRGCGGKHMPKQCPAFGKTCHNCNKKNHFARACLKGKQSSNRSAYEVDDDELFIGTVETSTPDKVLTTEARYKVQNLSAKVENVPQVEAVESRNDEWYSTLKLGEHLVKLKLDTGAKCHVLPNRLFNKITQGQQQVSKSNTKLISYSGDSVQTVGQAMIECYYKNT